MICAMAVATQVKSTMNGNYAPKMKFTLESRSGKLSEICAGVSTRTKYEMKSVIQTATEKSKSMFESRK